MSGFQFVLKSENLKVFFNDAFKRYVLSILLTVGKKNCSSMGYYLGISSSTLRKCFDNDIAHIEDIQKHQIKLIQKITTDSGKGYLVTDGWLVHKRYAYKIDNLTYDRCGSHKEVIKGLAQVTLSWTNGLITIPLDTRFWVCKKDAGKEYLKKAEIAKALILEFKNKIDFAAYLADGAYCSKDVIEFLELHNIFYLLRIPCNRKITDEKGFKSQVRYSLGLNLIRNQRYKTIKATYQGIPCFIITHKRKGPKNSLQTVYIISNIPGLEPREYVNIFDKRWGIEKMFRTLKQHLGVGDCQARSSSAQRFHIFSTFFVFTELEIKKLQNRKKSPEEVLKTIRLQKIPSQHFQSIDLEGWFDA